MTMIMRMMTPKDQAQHSDPDHHASKKRNQPIEKTETPVIKPKRRTGNGNTKAKKTETMLRKTEKRRPKNRNAPQKMETAQKTETENRIGSHPHFDTGMARLVMRTKHCFLGLFRALRQILQDLHLEALDEQDGVIVDLLMRMGVTEAEPHVMIEQALEQTTRLDLVVQVLRGG